MPPPPDINGYGTAFNPFTSFDSFVNYARERAAESGAKTVITAKTDGSKPLADRVITLGRSQSDSVHKWSRTSLEKTDNNTTRELFRKTIVNMFGGESKIPRSVQKAMLLSDYDKGRPLTARRILAVKAAIDKDGTVYETFKSPETETAALADGFTKPELKNVARAVCFLRMANPGMTEAAAYAEVSKPYSPANRLLQYGGNFLKNPGNFARGLKLLDDFKAWHGDVVKFYNDNSKGIKTNFKNADTPTKLNAGIAFANTESQCEGLESFVFRDLAADPKADLSKTGEDLFGVANNATMRMIANRHDAQATLSLLSMPPETRRLLYAAFDALVPMATNAEEANARANESGGKLNHIRDSNILIARVVKNADALAARMAKNGQLTAKDVIRICFPDLERPESYDLQTLNDFTRTFFDRAQDATGLATLQVLDIMALTGCTCDEAIDSFKSGKPIPPLPHLSLISFDLNGHREGGVNQMKGDIVRVNNYGPADKDGKQIPGRIILPLDAVKNTVAFADGTNIVVAGGGGDGKDEARNAAADELAGKIKTLCGKGHVMQANMVAYCLSQSGKGALLRSLGKFGISSSEHAAVDVRLSKDPGTGAVTIVYSSPKELMPVRFSWTATVGIDGSCTTTPMVATGLDAAAKTMVSDAALRLGVQLDDAKAARAADLLQKYGAGMPLKNTRVFANFLVRLRLAGNKERMEKEEKAAANMADAIRKWADFAPEAAGKGIDDVEAAMKDSFNEVMDDEIEAAKKPGGSKYFSVDEDEISKQFTTDANRGVFKINGQVCPHDVDAVVAAFRNAVPGKIARQGISSILNQSIPNCFAAGIMDRLMLLDSKKHPGGILLGPLPGAENLVSRSYLSGHYETQMGAGGKSEDMGITYALDVAKDGKSATINFSCKCPMSAGLGPDANASFGSVAYKGVFKLDLSGAKPLVVDVKIGQQFSENV